jgi:hypothetical protein
MLNQSHLDGLDSTVHHIARCDEMSSSLGIGESDLPDPLGRCRGVEMRCSIGVITKGDEDVGLGLGVGVDLVVRAGRGSERSVLFVQLVVGPKDQRMRTLRTRVVAQSESWSGTKGEGMSAGLHLVGGGLAVLEASKGVTRRDTAVTVVGVLAEAYIGGKEQLGKER